MAGSHELYLGHFSLGAAPQAERFAAAAEAGFTGISLFWPEICEARRAEGGLAGVRERLERAGLAAPQMEIILLPAADGLGGFRDMARDIAETSAELGCEVAHAAALVKASTFDDLTRSFGALAEACAKAGVGCGIEFVPFLSAVPDLASATRLARAVDVPGAGVVLDTLHFFRTGAPWDELAQARGADIVSVQVNDGPLRRPCDDYHAEAMGGRLPPRDGEFDLGRFMAALAQIGVAMPLTVEVVSKALDRLPAREAARRLAEATRALLPARTEPQPTAG